MGASEQRGDVALAVATLARAHTGAGHAENSIQFLSTLGKFDEAFAVADAYFFDRGFSTGDLRFSPSQLARTRLEDRRTFMLFLPSTAPMRTDPRFNRLVGEIGLERYWRETGTRPDYRT